MYCSITVLSSILIVYNSLPRKKTWSFMWSFYIGYDISSLLATRVRTGTILQNLTGEREAVRWQQSSGCSSDFNFFAPFQPRVLEINQQNPKIHRKKSQIRSCQSFALKKYEIGKLSELLKADVTRARCLILAPTYCCSRERRHKLMWRQSSNDTLFFFFSYLFGCLGRKREMREINSFPQQK